MICTNCNSTINNNDSICPNCGSTVEHLKMRVPSRVDNSATDEARQPQKYFSDIDITLTSGSDTEINIAAERILVDFLSNSGSVQEKDVKDSVNISSFWNKKVKYITYDAFYQNRNVQSKLEPSDYVSDLPASTIDSKSFDVWQTKLDSYKEAFISEKNKYTLSESMLKCTSCDNTGKFPCTACKNGYNICPVCDGSKNYVCDDCGGKGERACKICGGIGSYTLYTTDAHGNKSPTVYTCPPIETCSRCDGYGRILCKRCVGHGRIPCNVCDGKATINCEKCNGKAWLKQSVEMEQTFDTYSDMVVTLGFFINKELYGDQYFQSIEPHPRDICTNTLTDSKPISHFANYDLSQLNRKFEDFLNSNLRCNVFRIREMMRIIAEVEFSIGKYKYHSLIDLSTGQLLFDTDPKQIIKALRELKASVNNDNNAVETSQTSEPDDEPKANSLKSIFSLEEDEKPILITTAATVAILHILICIIGKHYLGLLIGMPIFTAIPVVLTMVFWNKIKNLKLPENKILLYPAVIGISVIYVLLTFLIFHI